MGVLKSFVKDVFIYGFGKGIKKFIGIFLLPFYTKFLSVEDFGLIGVLGSLTFFLSAIFRLGLDSASGQFFYKTKDNAEKGIILYTLFIIRLILFIPAIVISFFSDKISFQLFKSYDYTWLVFISIMIEPINHLMLEQSHVFRYHRQPWKYNFNTIFKSLLNIGLGIGLVVALKMGVIGAQLATLISSVLVIIVSFLMFTRHTYTYQFSWYWTKEMLRFGFPIMLSSLPFWFVQNSNRFFMLKYNGLTDIGFYSIGNTFSQPIEILNMAVQMSFGIMFFKLYYEEENIQKLQSRKLAIDSSYLYILVAVLFAVLFSVFGKELVLLIANKKILPGIVVIPFITFSFIAMQCFQIMGPGINIVEKNWHFTWIVIIAAIINLTLNFIFIPFLGYLGAAIATMLTSYSYWLIKLYISQKYFYIEYKIFKILVFIFFAFSFSFIIPYFEINRNIVIPVYYKIGVFLLIIFTSYILKMFDAKRIMELKYLLHYRKIK